MNHLHYRQAISSFEIKSSNLDLVKLYQDRADARLGEKLMETLRKSPHPIVCKLETGRRRRLANGPDSRVVAQTGQPGAHDGN